jgi:hypothetical protein
MIKTSLTTVALAAMLGTRPVSAQDQMKPGDNTETTATAGTLHADDQAASELRVQHELHVCLAPAGKAAKSVLETIADGVGAGKIDAKKIDSAIGKLDPIEKCKART